MQKYKLLDQFPKFEKYTLFSEPPCIQNRVYCIFSDIIAIPMPYHLMPSMPLLCAFYVAITYPLKTSALCM